MFINIFVLHPGRLTWNLPITHLERKMIFQTSMIMFHVNLQGCKCNEKAIWQHRCSSCSECEQCDGMGVVRPLSRASFLTVKTEGAAVALVGLLLLWLWLWLWFLLLWIPEVKASYI